MPRHSQSRSFAKKKRSRSVRLTIIWAVTILSWSIAFIYLNRLEFFTIDHVSLSGADQDIIDILHDKALDMLQGDYMKVLPHSSTLIYPHGALVKGLSALSPRIDSLQVSRDGLHGLLISVVEKVPEAVVCPSLPNFDGNTLSVNDDGTCYLADASGFIFEQQASSSPSNAALPRYYAPALPNAVIGSYATSTPTFQELQSFVGEVRTGGISVDGLLIKDSGEYELYVDNPTIDGTGQATTTPGTVIIYVNEVRPLADQASNLIAFWNDAASKARAKGKPISFDYIDLRYGSNVFYKQTQ